jgi:orotidine-5'-phosphate decarboxylase
MTKRVFVAVDTASLDDALQLTKQLSPHAAGIKLGLEFFMAHGAQGMQRVSDICKAPIFLDVKLHDIPTTVAKAIAAIIPLDVAFVTVHCGGGAAMLEAAVDAANNTAIKLHKPVPMLLGVTVLTSLDATQLASVQQSLSPLDLAVKLAVMAHGQGLRGFVASAQEVHAVRATLGTDVTLVTPGIRPADTNLDDQKRVMTPSQAITAGANYLVIGRPITHAPDPLHALHAINASLTTHDQR